MARKLILNAGWQSKAPRLIIKKKKTVNETQFTHLFPKTWNAAPLMNISQHNWSTLKKHPVKWTAFQRQTCYECSGIKIHFSFSVCCGFCQMPWVTCCLCSRDKVKWTHVKNEKECLTGDGHLGYISSVCVSFKSPTSARMCGFTGFTLARVILWLIFLQRLYRYWYRWIFVALKVSNLDLYGLMQK